MMNKIGKIIERDGIIGIEYLNMLTALGSMGIYDSKISNEKFIMLAPSQLNQYIGEVGGKYPFYVCFEEGKLVGKIDGTEDEYNRYLELHEKYKRV